MRLILDIFGQTIRTLWAHKLRSFLTMFGIAWGEPQDAGPAMMTSTA